MTKYGVFSGSYFPVFGLNTGKRGPKKILYLDTFHAVNVKCGAVMRRQKNLRFTTFDGKVKVQKIAL